MLEINDEKLSERQRACIEHVGAAQERGVSFAEYCRGLGLNVNGWYMGCGSRWCARGR
jgi:hypothetical protein